VEHVEEEVPGGHGVNVQLLGLNRLLKVLNLVIFITIQQVKNGLKI
jgi:hypothetical protein